ncbi:MAG: tetratricopeptide repeat protein [Acidobacteriota bacterium]|nr:MAG: tetratricopeptide repeat protein [Acidobacteriota bacterium]
MSRRKAVALLAYLASSGGQRRRSTLAEFFWPDLENERALAALRRTLRSLRKHLGARFVVADRSSIGLNHDLLWVDVQELRDLASKVRSDVSVGDLLTEIGRRIALYRGELLEGFSLPDGDRFEDWLLLEREVVKRDFYLLLDRLATEHLRAGDIDTAIDVLHQHLHLNPHAEDVHRRVMELYARGGRRSEALQQFHRCAKLLKEGLGVFPGEQTLKLFEGIREGRIGPSNEAQGFQARSKGGPRGLPKSAGHFVGRDRELECIQERLQDEACRIVSVIGPGGVGKTQLALRIAGLARQFEDGIYFVRLEDTAEGSLPQKLAEDLRLALDPGSDPEQSILGFLAARETLLILDNFEHLTAEAALLSRIADRAPRTKILVTSRKRLNLQQEWIFELKGLLVPEGKSGENPGDFEAVDLFIKSVQRIKDDFFLSDENGEIVAKICRRLEGHPLAIELTSNWLRVLSCQEILQKIEEEATFPQSLMADLPERHRSIERVFESSIRLLTENERTALFRLSALRGFTAESAQQVAGADTATLLSLVDQSLLGREPSGRFGAHSLIRRFASERLKELPDEPESTERLHGEYFFGFLANARRDLRGSGQRKTLEQLREDLDNIRAAWNWAVSNGRMDLVDAALEGLWLFFSATGNYSEGQKMLSQAVERLDGTEALRLRSRLFSRLGRFETALGRLRTAEEYLKNGLSMAEDLNEEEEVALGLLHLSGLSYHLGDFATASRQLHGAIERLDALGDMHGKATALLQLSRIVAAQGDYDAARSHLERALEQFEAEKDQGGVARCLINLGGAEILGEELDKAVSRFEESLRLSKELGDSRRVAVCLGNLGLIHQKKGDLGR